MAGGPAPTAFEVKSARLSTGLRLPYVEHGARGGIPVILLHGYVDSWRIFESLLPLLPRSIRAFAVTQRGHGDADRPLAGYGLEELAADVAAFMDAVAVEASIVVGSSSGGYVAQRLAADHPERTLGLVLVGSPRSLRDKPVELLRTISELVDPIDPAFVRAFVESTLGGTTPPARLEEAAAESLKVPARVWRAAAAALFESVPPTEVAAITAPTVILWGDRDMFLPRNDQEKLAEAIPGSRLVVVEGAGHGLLLEQPERVAAEVAALAERLAAAGSAPSEPESGAARRTAKAE